MNVAGHEIVRHYYRCGRLVEEVVETVPAGESTYESLVLYISLLYRPFDRDTEKPFEYILEYYESFIDDPPDEFFSIRKIQPTETTTNPAQ